jgi:hypothetical protein
MYRNPPAQLPSAIIDQTDGQLNGLRAMNVACQKWLIKNNLVGKIKWNK